MVSREFNFNPDVLRRAITAADAAAGTAGAAQTAANNASTQANTASSIANLAKADASTALTTANTKEQFTDRLIANPGWIVLQPSGLIIEWGYTYVNSPTPSGIPGQANVVYQKLTLGRFPYSWVGVVSQNAAATESWSCTIVSLTITGGNITHQIAVRKQAGAVTSAAPDLSTVQWIAIGY